MKVQTDITLNMGGSPSVDLQQNPGNPDIWTISLDERDVWLTFWADAPGTVDLIDDLIEALSDIREAADAS